MAFCEMCWQCRATALEDLWVGSEAGCGPDLDHLPETSMLMTMVLLLVGWKQAKWVRVHIGHAAVCADAAPHRNGH